MLPNLDLLENEITYKASRSGGAGGQHVNKVSTKIELDFDVHNSNVLTDEQKEVILKKLASKITKDGILQIVSQSERSQLRNKKVVLDKFRELITDSFLVRTARKPTKIPRAIKEKRLRMKKIKAEIKKRRRNDY
jgi:ribosome-associated protein